MGEREKISLCEQVAELPMSAGCYLFENAKGEVIYVGKAKHLRNRVRSYFVESKEHSAKVRVMVRQIASMRHIVVDSEMDALLLENSLIKTLQPRYNILLKDGKTYPWIAITAEPFPRIISTRRLVKDGSQYFGPYSSISAQRAVLEALHDIVPLRTCRLKMSEESVAKGRHEVCLEYHLGNCAAPCVGHCDRSKYSEYVAMAASVLKGDLRPVRTLLEEEMRRESEALRFEQAAQYKARLDALASFTSRSVIVSAKIGDVDCFSLLVDGGEAYCNFLRVRNGSIVAVHTATLSVGVESDPRQIMTLGIAHTMESLELKLSPNVLVSHLPYDALFEGVNFVVPQRGEKRELLEFSLRSAKVARAERLKNLEIHSPERHTDRIMEAMQRELRLEREPRHIECFDNSNLLGTNPVASCVVFRDGKPSRKEYRHFNIKTVVGADDFASMREILTRRYSRLLAEGAELPDLIVVDGGKGQLSSAYEVMQELRIANKVPIVGLAKRLEEVFYPNDPMPYYLSRTGEPLKVICHIRDEAHRFGITHHRNRRSKNFIQTGLEGIEGIGEKSITALLRHFRTLSNLRKASLEEVAEVVGNVKAQKVKEFLDRQN
ncbi:MAG: excinuclease ABC subunit C [Alistipes sp.]|nr:excinuclease ABC subunit C [Alistipes sp.]